MRLVVFKHRCAPDGSGAKVCDVVQMIYDSLDVAAMTAEILIPCRRLMGIRSRIIRRISVCETVRHDEIYHIR